MDSDLPRILLVEDDTTVRGAVHDALCDVGYRVRALPDGLDAAQVARTFNPDLAVLDLRLPAGPDGLTLARYLRAAIPDLPVVMLTAADAVDDRLAGFDAGADDYLVKPFAMAELLARVRALLRRAGRLTSETIQVGDLVIDEAGRRVVRGDDEVELTRTEFDVLLALARYPNRVRSKSQLLSDVWGFDAYDPNLVEVHVSSLRRKLEAGGRPRVIETVRASGYALRP